MATFAVVWALGTTPTNAAQKTAATETIQLSIGGGTADSAAFRWSSALAEVLSRPPGLPECDPGTMCGIEGVIAGAQTYDDPHAALAALLDGRIATAVIPAQQIYQARCALRSSEQSPIGILKILYRQPVQIVVRADMAAAWPKSLSGKSLSIGEKNSNAETVGLAFIESYGLSRAKITLVRGAPASTIAALKSGAVGAAVFVGHAQDSAIAELLSHGFTIVSLPDGPERRRLLEALPTFEAGAIPQGTYPNLPPVSILAQPVVWAAGPGLSALLAEKLIAAVSEPHNSTRLSDLVAPFQAIPEGAAFLRLPAPLLDAAAGFAKARKFPIEILQCVHATPTPPPGDKAPAKRGTRSAIPARGKDAANHVRMVGQG